jgi:hypothetical protein
MQVGATWMGSTPTTLLGTPLCVPTTVEFEVGVVVPTPPMRPNSPTLAGVSTPLNEGAFGH